MARNADDYVTCRSPHETNVTFNMIAQMAKLVYTLSLVIVS